MHLQWFPGHMTKAIRMMEEQVKLCHGIIYVLDARAPFACLNKKLEGLFGNKPVVYVVNKVDLIEKFDIEIIKAKFNKLGKKCVFAIGTEKKFAKEIYNEIFSSLEDVLKRAENKGINKTLRVMVVGIPNTGKSTIINSICGEKRAKTGDKAGVTRDKQWIKLDKLELLDTPGTTPPNFDDQDLALHLAFIGSLNDEIIDQVELSMELIGFLKINYPDILKNVYKVDDLDKPNYDLFLEIGKKRGCLKKGGDIDDERTSKIFMNDFRQGRLGKIYFDR